jgi:hypothetical protein
MHCHHYHLHRLHSLFHHHQPRLPTASAIKRIAAERKLRLPVLEAIADMVGGKLPAQAIVMHVMTLPLGAEESGMPLSAL